MAEAAIVEKTWQVGRYTVTMTVQKLKPGELTNACCRWEPELPGKLSAAEYAEYKRGRDKIMSEAIIRSFHPSAA